MLHIENDSFPNHHHRMFFIARGLGGKLEVSLGGKHVLLANLEPNVLRRRRITDHLDFDPSVDFGLPEPTDDLAREAVRIETARPGIDRDRMTDRLNVLGRHGRLRGRAVHRDQEREAEQQGHEQPQGSR